MRRIRKKQKGKGKYLALAFAIVLIIIVAVVVVATTSQGKKPKATEYLSISWFKVYARNYTQSSIIVEQLYFNITPIGGDAHYILVSYEGSATQDVQSIPRDFQAKGEPWYDVILFSNYMAPIVDGKVILQGVITVGCQETTGEEITFEIPLEEITFLPS